MIWNTINPINSESLRDYVSKAQPFPHFIIDNFLETGFANDIHECFPKPSEVRDYGLSFNTVNEQGKTQVTDSKLFPEPIQRLNSVLADPEWLTYLSDMMGLPPLLADSDLLGGGIHQTGPRGRLDVHVDFNYIPSKNLHRRLNILLYFNKDWRESWGGNIELWDEKVKTCHHSFSPIFNRCVVFATNDVSYHGVTRVDTPAGVTRNSFAAYYYTKEAPPEWTGEEHSTIFRARPQEKLKGGVLMPLEGIKRKTRKRLRKALARLRG